jgi:uncharacterized protein (TIGR02588 family)
MPDWSAWLKVIGGGLAGSLLTLIGQKVIIWWNAPHLEIVLPSEFVTNVNGDYWVRLRISNTGRSAATQSRVLAKLSEPETEAEIFDMCWADWPRQADTLAVTIPSKTSRYIDVFHTHLRTRKIDFLPYNNIEEHKYDRCILTFFAAADNARTTARDAVCSKTDRLPWISVMSHAK